MATYWAEDLGSRLKSQALSVVRPGRDAESL